jgi:hypothetical protein
MSDGLSTGIKLAREIITEISKNLHGIGLTFDEKLDLLGEIVNYCDDKIEETWDESLQIEEEVEV